MILIQQKWEDLDQRTQLYQDKMKSLFHYNKTSN